MSKWSVVAVAGLGVFDSVAGATTLTQVSPVAGSSTVPATTGVNLNFVFQCVGTPGKPASWQVIGTLPTGLVHANAVNSTTDAIQGIPTQSGSFPITIKAWESPGYAGKSFSANFTIVVSGSPPSGVPPSITTQPSSVTINSGSTATLTVAASGTPAPTYQWYLGASGVTTSPISGATSASYTTPALTATGSYWARATNASGTANSTAATVSVITAPAITTQPSSVTINSGSTATFSVVASGTSPTYQWYQGASGVTTSPISGATSASYTTPALTANGSYWVRVTNAAGIANSTAATATVITAPAITTQPSSVTISSGATATFSVVASGTSPTYQWYQGASGVTTSPISGATSASYTTPALTATTSYWVRVSNSAGIANSNAAAATVTVITAPAITTQPSSVTINSGATATFSVVASGTSPTYQWYVGNSGVTTSPILGATSASYTTPALTTTTSYWVRATNSAGTANSTAATATVITAPAITTQPSSVTINSGATATFGVVASGTSPTYQWYVGNSGVTTSPISGATSASYTTPALTTTTSYWVRATNSAGTADSVAATVTVNPVQLAPPSILTGPASITINSGNTTSLTVTASGSPSPTYQWYVGNSGVTTSPISGATSANYTTPALTTTTSYWVRATNSQGAADSVTATITVITAPAITTQPSSVTINSGATATFSVVASGTSPTYQWYVGNSGVTTSPISGATGASYTTPALTTTTSYWVRVTNAVGNANSTTATATIITAPAITTQPGSVTINSGAAATFNVVASGTSPSYQWYLGNSGVTTSPISGATSASYTTSALTTTTTYWVRATNAAGSADSAAATATVINAPAITTQPSSVSINSGVAATFSVVASGTSPTYQWYVGNAGVTTSPISGATSSSYTTPALTTTTSYWVRVSNAAGTANSVAATATVITAPVITTQPGSVTINSGSTAAFSVVVSGSPAPTFQWYQGASGDATSPILGATSASYTTAALTATTSYWVRATNSVGTADSTTATATVTTGPVITTQPSSVTINSGAKATFSVLASGTSLSYQWYVGNSGVTTSPISGAISSSYTTPALTTTTSYWVRVTNTAGNASSTAATATVITAPVITTQPRSVTINSGGTATFSVVASGTSPSYQWYVGSSGVTTSPISGATSASYTTPALTTTSGYWVRVSNAAGTVDSAAVTATVAAVQYVLTTTSTNGSITGGGSYAAGSSIAISATPSLGYVFTGWTGDASGTTNPLTVVMNANKSIGATFAAIAADSDSDGISDLDEVTVTGTDPNRADTDGDGIIDGIEVNMSHTNPRLVDSNSDGFSDAYAFCIVGNPVNPMVGNEITFDLGKLVAAGMSLKVSGKIPAGLSVNRSNVMSGVVSGSSGTYQVRLQVIKNKVILADSILPITVRPFPPTLMGDFEMLLEDSDSRPVGICRLTISKPGQWSATLEKAGSAKQNAKGTFSADSETNSATIQADFLASKTGPVTSVTVLINEGSPLVKGNYSGGTLRGFRLAVGAENPPAKLNYNLVLDPGTQDGFTVPGGIGWMKGNVSNRGVGAFGGVLGDGTKCSVSLRLSSSGQAILWAQPYSNKGSFIGGVITLANTGQSVDSNKMLVDGVWWFKGAEASSKSYPNGFPIMPITVGSSRWIAPSNANALGASLGWRNNRTASLTFDSLKSASLDSYSSSSEDGDDDDHNGDSVIKDVLPSELTIDDKFNLVASAPATKYLMDWSAKVGKSDGSVSGVLTVPAGTVPLGLAGKALASGVLVQDESWGAVTGCGLMQVPVSGSSGQFITTAFVIEQ